MALRDLWNNRNADSWGTRSQDYRLVSKLYRVEDFNQDLKKKQQSFHHWNGHEISFCLPASLLGSSKWALFTHSNSFTCNKKREEEYMTFEIDLEGVSFFLFFSL